MVMKPNGSSWRIVDNSETRWEVLDFMLDSRGCVLLLEENWNGNATRLRVLSFNSQTTVTRTRDLVRIGPESRPIVVCVQITPFY